MDQSEMIILFAGRRIKIMITEDAMRIEKVDGLRDF